MKSKNAPKVLPELAEVKAAIIDAVTRHLTTAVSSSDNTYFTVPNRQMPLRVGNISGTFALSLFNLKDAALAEAATIEAGRDVVDKLSDEQLTAILANRQSLKARLLEEL